MPQKRKPFGVPYDPSIPYRSGWDCPECGWTYFSAIFKLDPDEEVLVGFTPEQPFPSNTLGTTGILIVECPNDFTKFWFHTMRDGRGLDRDRRRIEGNTKTSTRKRNARVG